MRTFDRTTIIDYDVNSMYWWTPNFLKPMNIKPQATSMVKLGKIFFVEGYGFSNNEVSAWLKTNCRSWVRLRDGIEFHHHGDAMLFLLRWS